MKSEGVDIRFASRQLRAMLGAMQEGRMAIYSGTVIENSGNEDFPYLAIISDDTGKVIGEFPVRTTADGDEKIVEALQELKDMAEKEAPLA